MYRVSSLHGDNFMKENNKYPINENYKGRVKKITVYVNKGIDEIILIGLVREKLMENLKQL